MRRITTVTRVAFECFLALVWATGTVPAATGDQFVYTVRIPATNNHQEMIQTGFRLKGTAGVITALHGVADGTLFSAYNDQGDGISDLKLEAVDVDRDLALLSCPALATAPKDGLSSSSLNDIVANVELIIPGHPAGVQLKRRHAASGDPVITTLNQTLPSTADFDAAKFEARKSPLGTIRILNISGAVGSGESGAPVMLAGKVVGVVDGGLRGYGLGWAIPIEDGSWKSPSDETGRLAALRTANVSALFSIEVAKTTRSDLDARAQFVGYWIPVTSAFAQRSQEEPIKTEGHIYIHFNEEEQLEAEGNFDFQSVVRDDSSGVFLNDQTLRVKADIDSIDPDVHYFNDHYTTHIGGAIKSGYWGGSDWLKPRGNFPKDEANCEVHVSSDRFLSFHSHYNVVLFRRASARGRARNSTVDNAGSNTYKVRGVDSSDTLSMRTSAGADQGLVAHIPPDADGIEITGAGVMIGSDEWVLVHWQDKQGWVSKKYLAPSIP